VLLSVLDKVDDGNPGRCLEPWRRQGRRGEIMNRNLERRRNPEIGNFEKLAQ